MGTEGNFILFHFGIGIISRNQDQGQAVFFANADGSVNMTDNSLPFRFTGFKQFFNTGQPLGDVPAGDPAGVEGSHGQLGPRFPDGLGSYRTNRFTDINHLTGCQVAAVAMGANAVAAVAG